MNQETDPAVQGIMTPFLQDVQGERPLQGTFTISPKAESLGKNVASNFGPEQDMNVRAH